MQRRASEITQLKCGEMNQLLCELQGPRSNDVQSGTSMSARSGFLTPFSIKRNQDSVEKWLDLQLGQELHRTSLQHHVIQKVRKYLKQIPTVRGCDRGTWEPSEPGGQNGNDFHSKIKQHRSITRSMKYL